MPVRVALVACWLVAACEARMDEGAATVARGRPGKEPPVGARASQAGRTDEAGGPAREARAGSGSGASGGGSGEGSEASGGGERQAVSGAASDGGGEASGASGEERGAASDGGGEASGASGAGIRLVILADHALLGSEVKGLARLESELAAGGGAVTRVEAAGEERAAAEGIFGGAAPTSLPTSWPRAATVVVVRVAAPRETRSGSRLSRGVTDVALLRPPRGEPELRMRVDESVAVRADESWSRWVAELARGGGR